MTNSVRVTLIQSVGSSNFAQRTRRGTYLVFGSFVFILTLLLYFCSLDYENLIFERRLLRYHQLVPGANNVHESDIPSERHKDEHDNGFVRPEFWNTRYDQGNKRPQDAQISNYFDQKSSLSKFDISGSDVIVSLEIQNTGGNVFGRHLVEDLLLDRPCNCRPNHRRCDCWRPNADNTFWLFSRLTVGWKCGVHPDWTELTYCVDRALDELEGQALKRRYFYITLLRDPVTRFLSEYNRAKSLGGLTPTGRHFCGGREVNHILSCNFSDAFTLEDYISCPQNLAINRQTRMLSDLALVNCYNFTSKTQADRDLISLTSAKSNLHQMAFFGLTEYPRISQKLFEQTFDMMFLDADHSLYRHREKRSLLDGLSQEAIESIKQANHLDMQVYEYAKGLLFDRFDRLEKKYSGVSKEAFMAKEDVIDWGEKEDEASPRRKLFT